MNAKGHWFKFVLYKQGTDKRIEAKLVEFWAANEARAHDRIEVLYPEYQQWFSIQTSWLKQLAGLFTFSKIVKWKW